MSPGSASPWGEGQAWSRVGLGLTQSGLSPFPDSLGPRKDDMLLVETRGPQDNGSLCALEPSGCTPLLSRASTVRDGGPSSMSLSSCISHLTSNFHSLHIPLLQAKPCAGLWKCGGDLDLDLVLNGLSEVSQPPSPTILPTSSLVGRLDVVPLGDSPHSLAWQRAARLGEQLLQDVQSGQCLQVSRWQEGPSQCQKATGFKPCLKLFLPLPVSSRKE